MRTVVFSSGGHFGALGAARALKYRGFDMLQAGSWRFWRWFGPDAWRGYCLGLADAGEFFIRGSLSHAAIGRLQAGVDVCSSEGGGSVSRCRIVDCSPVFLFESGTMVVSTTWYKFLNSLCQLDPVQQVAFSSIGIVQPQPIQMPLTLLRFIRLASPIATSPKDAAVARK
jgi:hypothetical protein